MEISIIIPAYNEEKIIRKSISKVIEFLEHEKIEYELIVVDDCSTDRTGVIIKNFNSKKVILIKNKNNMGKGCAIKEGILNAKKDLILFSDADLSTPIKELSNLLKYIDDYDIVIGSRRIDGSLIKIKQPFYRTIPGRIFPILVNLMILRGIKDTQCGFKLFKRNAAKDIFQKQRIKGFCFDVEILYLAKKAGYKIKEVPITWNNSADSKVNIIADPIKMFIDLLKIWFRH